MSHRPEDNWKRAAQAGWILFGVMLAAFCVLLYMYNVETAEVSIGLADVDHADGPRAWIGCASDGRAAISNLLIDSPKIALNFDRLISQCEGVKILRAPRPGEPVQTWSAAPAEKP